MRAIASRMMKSKIMVLLVVLVIGIAAYAYINNGPVDGAPQATIDVYLREVNGGTMSGTVDTQEEIIKTPVPMQAYTADIIGVDPQATYEIEFVVKFTGDLPEGAPSNLTMYGDVTIWGETPYYAPDEVVYHSLSAQNGTLEVEDITLTPPYYAGTAQFLKSSNLQFDSVKAAGENPTVIKGAFIDGSVFYLTMTTSCGYAGTNAYYGTTTATITLNVDPTGNVNITVTDVNMTATEV